MKLQEMIAAINFDIRKKAEELMEAENFHSLKDFGDGYEALIFTGGKLLLTEVVLGKKQNVLEYDCQCTDNIDICVHVAAVLIGVEKMIQTKCDDYHEAVQKLKQK
jgi:uncharacterized Zn finger protein